MPNVFQYIQGGGFAGGSVLMTVQQLSSLLGDGHQSLIYPPGLAQDSTSSNRSIPYVLFAPYIKQGLTSLMDQNQHPNMVLDNLPPPQFVVALPLPASALATSTAVAYEEADLGVMGGMIASNIIKSFNGDLGNAAGGAAIGAAVSALTAASVGADWVTGGIIGAATGSIIGKDASVTGMLHGLEAASSAALQTDVGTIFKKGFGFQENPFTEVLFKRVPFRVHRFDYVFFPKTAAESKILDKILQVFKFYMLPAVKNTGVGGLTSTTGAILSFPYEFQITYSVQSTTFTLLPSVLESISINYSDGTDSPRFFKVDATGKEYPTKVTVSMIFREIYMLTRDRVSVDVDDVVTNDLVLTNNPGSPVANSSPKVRYRF